MDFILRNPSSYSSLDPYKDDLDVELSKLDFFSTINNIINGTTESKQDCLGIECFHLAYKVAFPISLVLSQKVVIKYQLIFRFLFLLKVLEYRLCINWVDITSLLKTRSIIKQTPLRKSVSVPSLTTQIHPQLQILDKLKPRVLMLTSRIQISIQQFMYYNCYQVIEPNWISFEEQVDSCTSFQKLMDSQHEFLDILLRKLGLTSALLVNSFKKLVHVSTQFSNWMQWFCKRVDVLQGNPSECPRSWVITSDDDLLVGVTDVVDQVRKFESVFCACLVDLVKELRYTGAVETGEFSDLADRLDFNGCYTSL